MRTLPFGESHFFGDEDIEAVSEVILSGRLGKGPKVAQFEREFAARHGVSHVVSLTSGTAAMHTCIGTINPEFRAMRSSSRPGHREAASSARCCITACPSSPTLTTPTRWTRRTLKPRSRPGRAPIIAVHLFGNPCEMAALRDIADRHQLFLSRRLLSGPLRRIPGAGGRLDGRHQRLQLRRKASLGGRRRRHYDRQRDALGTRPDLL